MRQQLILTHNIAFLKKVLPDGLVKIIEDIISLNSENAAEKQAKGILYAEEYF